MRVVSGIASILFVAGCTLQPLGGEDTFLGAVPVGGKADGTDMCETFVQDGVFVTECVDYSDFQNPYVYHQMIDEELPDGTYRSCTTFPGQGCITYAFHLAEDSSTTISIIDSTPPAVDLDLTLAQVESLYGDVSGGADDYGKADGEEKQCQPTRPILECLGGGVLAVVGAKLSWAIIGVPLIAVGGAMLKDCYDVWSMNQDVCVTGGTGGSRTPSGSATGASRTPYVAPQTNPPVAQPMRVPDPRNVTREGGQVYPRKLRQCPQGDPRCPGTSGGYR